MRRVVLAGGCFWGTQDYLKQIHGVVSTSVGYANGLVENPTYELVCTGRTGYVEAVDIMYDPSIISLGFLLDVFYESIDPVSINKQGGDVGPQYRTGIYYVEAPDRDVIVASLRKLQEKFDKKIAIEVEPLKNYYRAEDYHQDYLDKNPNGYCHISAGKLDYARKVREYRVKSDVELKEMLTPLQYEVTQHGGTEAPFDNAYDAHFEKGIYVDITSGEPLFLSKDKYDAGCGWPSFTKPIYHEYVDMKDDNRYGMRRVEVLSGISKAHLGHVFTDGIKALGGLRYCMNSAALKFVPYEDMEAMGYGRFKELLDD